MFIDTHTHIYADDFQEDREAVIARAIAAGARELLLPNIDEQSLPNLLALCQQYPKVCRPMLGLHSTEVPAAPDEILDRMEAMLTEDHPFIAIGEVGVDLYWDASLREVQMEAFRRQATWAVKAKLPLVIHTRSAHREVVDTLLPLKEQLHGGIFHCFGGTAEEAQELLSFKDFYLGIGGVVTFKKSTLPEVLRTAVPLERIVLETDAPYLAPTPYRGKRNEPSYIPLIAATLATVYDTDIYTIYSVTTQNASQLFQRNAL